MAPVWKPAYLRQQEIQKIQQAIPHQIEKLKWSRTQIEIAQLQGLREIIAHAKKHSPWHQKRLSHIDESNLTIEQIQEIPIMTKEDVMANWDEVVCDRDLTLKRANEFLRQLQPEHFEFYQEKYHIYETGGSSGLRGVFVWNLEDSIECAVPFFRYQYQDEFLQNPNQQAVVAVFASNHPVHKSTPIFSVPFTPNMKIHCIYAHWPLEQMLKYLNELQPTHLVGFTSIIYKLAQQAHRNRLHITPKRLSINSEPLLPEMRNMIQKIWPVPISNIWGSTECGVCAANCDFSENLHLSEDRAVFEFVDEDNRSIDVGKKCHKILATLFYNKTMPMIRYQLDDQVTVIDQPCLCGSQYRQIKNIIGRFNDNFEYPNHIFIPTLLFESLLFDITAIVEFQIFQTQKGAEVWLVIQDATFNTKPLQQAIQKAYKAAGLLEPQIEIKIVNQLKRHPQTGKLRQFVSCKL